MAKARKKTANDGRGSKPTRPLTKATLSAAVGLAMASASGQLGLVQQVAKALEEMVPRAEAQPTVPGTPRTPGVGTPIDPRTSPTLTYEGVRPPRDIQASPIADWGQEGGWAEDCTGAEGPRPSCWGQRGGWYLVKDRQGLIRNGGEKRVDPRNVRKALEQAERLTPIQPPTQPRVPRP